MKRLELKGSDIRAHSLDKDEQERFVTESMKKAGFNMSKDITYKSIRSGGEIAFVYTQEEDTMIDNPTSCPCSPLRMKFLADTDGFTSQAMQRTHLVVAVELPTGATEIIINTEQLESKIEYYRNAYDDNFCLKANPAIQIVGYMLV